MFCSNCGSKLESGDIFCGNCGAEVKNKNGTSRPSSSGYIESISGKTSATDFARFIGFGYLAVGVVWLLWFHEIIHSHAKLAYLNSYSQGLSNFFSGWIYLEINFPLLLGFVVAILSQVLFFKESDKNKKKILRNISHEYFLVVAFYLFLSFASLAAGFLVYLQALVPAAVIIVRSAFALYRLYGNSSPY